MDELYTQCFNFTMKNEGGYSNNSADIGGETYKGISRYYHPGWIGWDLIDILKKQDTFPQNLAYDDTIDLYVKDFYYSNYYMQIKGEDIKSPIIVGELFDMAVSIGVKRTTEFLQEALFVLGFDIKIDGMFGLITLSILNQTIDKRLSTYIVEILNARHTNYYIKRCLKKPDQRVFAKGWINRSTKRFRPLLGRT